MSNVKTQGKNIGDVVKWMVDPDYCIEKVTIAQDADATAGLEIGQVLETNSTKKIVCASGANADAILLEPVVLADLIAGDCERIALINGPAIIDSDNLIVATDQKTAALAALKELGIKEALEPDTIQTGYDDIEIC